MFAALQVLVRKGSCTPNSAPLCSLLCSVPSCSPGTAARYTKLLNVFLIIVHCVVFCVTQAQRLAE
eukprot:1137828-Pelagomonas_calceolata.AAC.5